MRTLILVIVVSGTVFGLIAARVNRARKNRQREVAVRTEIEKAVAELRQQGGRVHFKTVHYRNATWLGVITV